ncbi:unnamed protein product, partial [Rotaria sp. Silwood1]
MRNIDNKFRANCLTSSIQICSPLNENHTFILENLSFAFAKNCSDENVLIDVDYIILPDSHLFNLPECICVFRTKYHDKSGKLNDMPIVSFVDEPNARLYNWVQPSSYWYSYRTRQTRLFTIGETYAFVRYIDIIPSLLSLPPDMFIKATIGKLFEDRSEPVSCRSLKVRE